MKTYDSCCIFSNKDLIQGFSSMNFTTFWKSFQRFNNSIPAGAEKALNFFSAFFVYINTREPPLHKKCHETHLKSKDKFHDKASTGAVYS